MKKVILYPLAFIMLTVSCVSKQKYDELEKKLKHLEIQNSELHKTLTLYMEKTTPRAAYEPQDETAETPEFAFPKYAFVVLEVEEVTRTAYENGAWNKTTGKFNSTSQIQEFKSFNEDTKYRFMDEITQHYKLTNSREGQVNNRRCFVFNSYEEASKEREKYVIQ
jgi:hypothetical protein